jgi:hypothetical protein
MEGAVRMRRVVLLMAVVGLVFLGVVGSALGATVSVCVPSGEGAAITTPTGGSCGSGTSVLLPAEPEEQKKLISILPHINYEASGIDEKPTVQFSGVNLQVINGSKFETTINGTGNLIIGYDESPGTQTGSHNLLLGGTDNSYTSYGGIVGGYNDNKISGPYASILGGGANIASGVSSTITGGYANKTSTSLTTVSGGCSNLAGVGTVTVNGACTDTAYTDFFASVLGGTGNQASAENASVSGGAFNLAGDLYTSISGGCDNLAAATGSRLTLPGGMSCDSSGAQYASISGGGGGEATAPDASVVGGRFGKAKYFASTVLGELSEETHKEYEITP